MNVANLLSHDPPRPARSQQAAETLQHEPQRVHQYPTRHSVMSNNVTLDTQNCSTTPISQAYSSNPGNVPAVYNLSPVSPAPKNITFKLLDPATNQTARLPMRVQIWAHDTTDSIVSTTKNFFGLYEEAVKGLSFEDDHSNTLIARYENFRNNMTVYVRVIPNFSPAWKPHAQNHPSTSPINASMMSQFSEGFHMPPPQAAPAQILDYGQPISRPASRIARKQSASPRPGRSRRSVSAQKPRSRSGMLSREGSFQGYPNDIHSDTMKGYSSSDGEGGSVTSSRKARSEQLASAEISLDNILEGNRRKRAKFESSELPLFVPPQVPAANSISSISPQRRSNGLDNASPFTRPTQRNFTWSQPLPSPQNYGFGEHAHGIIAQNKLPGTAPPVAEHGRRLRDRTNPPSLSTRSSTGMVPRAQGFGILPTPDPTIASCISDEDVALQLMRLGDASNISHGRTSASTLDDTLSGRADAASSATSDSDEDEENEEPSLPTQKAPIKFGLGTASQLSMSRQYPKHNEEGLPSTESMEPSDNEVDEDYTYDGRRDGHSKNDLDEVVNEHGHGAKSRLLGSKQSNVSKASSINSFKNKTRVSKTKASGHSKKAKASSLLNASKIPPSPTSTPTQSRKTSSASMVNFQHQGEEDLSSKPRCQRCRKSKKGCDRQRPCQRCKDAGIGADGCISEDEGNGRKGRFGRHMGVTVKKEGQEPAANYETDEAGVILGGIAASQEKSKKRKR